MTTEELAERAAAFVRRTRELHPDAGIALVGVDEDSATAEMLHLSPIERVIGLAMYNQSCLSDPTLHGSVLRLHQLLLELLTPVAGEAGDLTVGGGS